MAVTVPPVPHKIPVLDQEGIFINPTWSAWFREVFNRIGGSVAPSNSDFEENLADVSDLEDAVALLQTQVAALQAVDSDFGQGPDL